MRKTATGALWLQYYVDKNSPGTILVLAKQDYFAHIIRPLIRVFVYSIIWICLIASTKYPFPGIMTIYGEKKVPFKQDSTMLIVGSRQSK